MRLNPLKLNHDNRGTIPSKQHCIAKQNFRVTIVEVQINSLQINWELSVYI